MKLETNHKSILVIPDLQIPYHHPDAIRFLVSASAEYWPDEIISIGDEVDQYGLSRFPKDPDEDSAGRELEQSLKVLGELYEEFPDVRAVTSNHLLRIFKKAEGAGIPKGYLKSIKEFMGAPKGWSWNEEVYLDGIKFEHGDACAGLMGYRALAESNRCSTCVGHHHSSAGIHYLSNGKEVIFAMNVGCLVDQNARAFAYTRESRHKPVLSCGLIKYGAPIIVPMITKSNGRWDSKNQVWP
jgi:hypothetical protein